MADGCVYYFHYGIIITRLWIGSDVEFYSFTTFNNWNFVRSVRVTHSKKKVKKKMLSEWSNSLFCPLATNHIVFAKCRNNSHTKQLTWHKSFTRCNWRSRKQLPHDYSNREGPFLYHQHQCVPTKHFVHCNSSSVPLTLWCSWMFFVYIFLLLFLANLMKVYRHFWHS